MLFRSQRTLRQSVDTQGVGLFTGSDVRLRFLPAPANHGIAFQRVDVAGSSPIPARIEFVASSLRRTTIARDGVQVEMIEHVMAALTGMQIDNCLIELNGPEVPGFDGSCLEICRLLIEAGCVEQDHLREVISLRMPVQVSADESEVEVSARPMNHCGLAITYQLDYGDRSPIPPQNLTAEITPETFFRDIAFARTFVLESEVAALRSAGYGLRMTSQDLLVFDASGKTSTEYGAKVTPHLYVLDGKRTIQYVGSFDDKQKEPSKHYVADAVDAVLAGKTVETASTKAFGCGIQNKK